VEEIKMTDPQINCPNCGFEIKLTESLAAPLIEVTRKSFQDQLALKDAEMAREKAALRLQQDELTKAKENFEEQLAAKLSKERMAIATSENKKAREAVAIELEGKAKQVSELQQVLDENNTKLAEAQKAQADLLKKQRELDEKIREADLTIERRIQQGLAGVQTKAKQDAAEALNLTIAEKDKQLSDMAKTVEELKRKLEQGSQQTQGEVLELAFEELLRNRFPHDIFEPVGKGEFGGDVIQHVNAAVGAPSGIILWEFKRTKTWSDSWLPKLRQDQRIARADIALIVSQALPRSVEHFELVDGIWVAHPRCALPVGAALRKSLMDVASLRISQQGQNTKMELVYDYLTGPRFKQRIEAVLEKFNDMRKDLDRERTFMQKQWAKREAQLLGVLGSTTGLYGDLQGIAGQALPEIESLERPQLEAPDQRNE
jgi:hypothetical protein